MLERTILDEGLTAIASMRKEAFIAGSFNDYARGRRPIVNPSTAKVLCEVAESDGDEVLAAVQAAENALPSWRRTTPKERADLLYEIATRIDSRADILAKVESLNVGKPLDAAREEMLAAADLFRFMAGAARTSVAPAPGQYLRHHHSHIRREAIGVVGGIVPWNYPLMMAAWKLAPALAAGNTVVLKPSELTPLTTLLLADILRDAIPAGVLNIVLGDGSRVGNALVIAEGVGMISFTGSARAGRLVASAAGEGIKRLHLELGGKAPVLVFEDANLDDVVAGAQAAGFANSGQDCGAATRILCQSSIAGELAGRLAAEIGRLVVGDPGEGSDVEVGPLISSAHREKVKGLVERAVADGAEVAVGGREIDGPGYYYAPTVLTNVRGSSEISQTEVFGPVVTIQTFHDELEALHEANGTEYGLAASVWTRDLGRAARATDLLDFGTVWVNTHLPVVSEMPWVGFGGSGYGRDMSIYALDDHSRTKHVMVAESPLEG